MPTLSDYPGVAWIQISQTIQIKAHKIQFLRRTFANVWHFGEKFWEF